MIEIGGGAASSTVISPKMFREYCLPYDQRQVRLMHDLGLKVVYHLCGGVMPMLDLVAETGSDGLETMTPPTMGGDCDLREASRRAGEKLFFIGGFDQNAGFERGPRRSPASRSSIVSKRPKTMPATSSVPRTTSSSVIPNACRRSRRCSRMRLPVASYVWGCRSSVGPAFRPPALPSPCARRQRRLRRSRRPRSRPHNSW